MKDVLLKAVPVNAAYTFVKQELGPDRTATLVAEFPASEAVFLTGHLLATESVPLSVVNRFTARAASVLHEPVKAFARRAGHYGAEQGLKSVYRFIMTLATVEFVLKRAPLMWTRVYDSGTMTVETLANRATIRIGDFPGNEAGCGRILGWFETIGETAGAKELKVVHTSCTAEGGAQCVWSFEWK